ncbi:hypothetical protein K3758_05045 [Sulfitobacter sp. W002]|uniref:hypothetical protein n=1 Tax=Sulfitobacter sp. W002 TaxID=2867024 RepID=UPI0021A35449|nr:hypothetical protein [Sulfitobacter sp. W002]UWR30901.1 hypothetical protein K3758_05045 [Sulfitobacter sp. W002]
MPILMLQDFHPGEVIDPKTSYGYAYNVAIAEDRLRRTIERTATLVRGQMASGSKCPGIVCSLGGDMVSGETHQELIDTNEMGVGEQMIHAVDLCIGAITALAEEFGKVFVPCATGVRTETWTVFTA